MITCLKNHVRIMSERILQWRNIGINSLWSPRQFFSEITKGFIRWWLPWQRHLKRDRVSFVTGCGGGLRVYECCNTDWRGLCLIMHCICFVKILCRNCMEMEVYEMMVCVRRFWCLWFLFGYVCEWLLFVGVLEGLFLLWDFRTFTAH